MPTGSTPRSASRRTSARLYLRAIRVSLLRDLLSAVDELPEIDDELSTDDGARRLIAFARMHAARIERRLH
jgi:hypothetical protein